jgi:hypothetical protein
MHEIENLGHRMKLQRAITLQKRNALSAKSENPFQTKGQFLTLHNRLMPICRCGMIRKITRSTNRISINGTTWTPDKIPRLPPKAAKAIRYSVDPARGVLSH